MSRFVARAIPCASLKMKRKSKLFMNVALRGQEVETEYSTEKVNGIQWRDSPVKPSQSPSNSLPSFAMCRWLRKKANAGVSASTPLAMRQREINHKMNQKVNERKQDARTKHFVIGRLTSASEKNPSTTLLRGH